MTLAELFDAEYERLAKYLARRSDPETGEDLASESFARHARENRPDPRHLWRTAMQTLTDWQRKESNRRSLVSTSDPVSGADANRSRPGTATSFVTLDGALFRFDFDRAFRALPRPLAEAFTVVELRGLSTREAASALGVPHRTLARRARLGRELLKGALG